jgi:5-methyltetrahydrofolate--homocysteine methyltransferase
MSVCCKTKPPFMGAQIISDVTIDEIEPLIDREALFAGRWQFRRGENSEEWAALKQRKCEPLFAKIVTRCRAKKIIRPMITYGYFECSRINNGLVVSNRGATHRFEFPREGKSPNRCIADFFPEGFVAMQLVTVGSEVIEETSNQFSQGGYSDAFFLKGIAAQAAEAMALFVHKKIRSELGVPEDMGERFSPGYPAFPDLFAQREMLKLLEAKRIGVTLTETCQLMPEYSTSAIVSIDPSAKIFRP